MADNQSKPSGDQQPSHESEHLERQDMGPLVHRPKTLPDQDLDAQSQQVDVGDAASENPSQDAERAIEDERARVNLFNSMGKLAKQMQCDTGVFTVLRRDLLGPKVLDLGGAPGGCLKLALHVNPVTRGLALTLPVNQGGYKYMLEDDRVRTIFVDVTLCAGDLGVRDFEPDHPAASRLLREPQIGGATFTVAICADHVLRSHEAAEHREDRESGKLLAAQLALGLGRLRPGGSMVVLLHDIENWRTARVLKTFNRFASVGRFKSRGPQRGSESSFYMLATEVQSKHPEAVRAISEWKTTWKTATFGTDEEFAEDCKKNQAAV